MKKILLVSAAFIFLGASARAASPRRPKNYRWKPKPAAEGVEISTAAEAAAEAARPPRLMAGRWTPEARAALEKFLAERGKRAPGYDPAKPPIAAFPWSDALVAGDPAELVFLRMTSSADFRFSDSWWEIVPIAYGRQPARAAYDHFITITSATWSQQPDYNRFRKEMLQSYLSLCRGVGRKECRSYLARLWAGWREDEAVDYAKAALAEEKTRLNRIEEIRSEDADAEPLKIRRGLRLVPAMRDLIAKLRANGVDVWIVDDLPQPVLLASTADYGVDPSRVLGIRNGPEASRMSAAVLAPVPTRGGKAEVLKAAAGRPADLVIGRDSADLDLMTYGTGLRIALTGDPELERRAHEKGWLIQPTPAR